MQHVAHHSFCSALEPAVVSALQWSQLWYATEQQQAADEDGDGETAAGLTAAMSNTCACSRQLRKLAHCRKRNKS